jgi:DNA polymerase-1
MHPRRGGPRRAGWRGSMPRAGLARHRNHQPRPLQARMVGISFAIGRAEGEAYLPLGHSYAGAPAQLPLRRTLARCSPGWNRRATASSASTSSTTATSSPTTASAGAAWSRTRCCSPTCSNRTRTAPAVTTSVALAMRHCGLATISYDAVTGKGAKRSFAQVDRAGRRLRRRRRRRHLRVHARCCAAQLAAERRN